MDKPLVYVLIINWNGMEHLQGCFDSLMAIAYPNVRLLLIDNGSSDGSVAFVRNTYGNDSRVEVLELDCNLGWAGGNNAGMEHAMAAGADFIFLLNNDTAVAPDVIERLLEAAQQRPQTAALAPKMLMFDCPDIVNSVGLECSIIGAAWDRGIGRLDGPRWDDACRVIGVCGGAAFYRAAVLKEIGLLSTDFEIYLDDLDLCMRMWDAGYEVWTCPEAVVRHKFSATTGTGAWARRKYFLNTRNRMLLMLRNFPRAKLPLAIATYKIGEMRAVGRALLEGEWWRVLAHVKSWGAFFSYLPKAVRARRESRTAGGSFWPLVRKDRMFFGGTEFPVDGWYAPRSLGSGAFRPMSRRAWLDAPEGRLRVHHMNCYPRLGATAIQVFLNGRMITKLATQDEDVCLLEVTAGRVDFVSERVFYADDTGDRLDVGGWIRIEHV